MISADTATVHIAEVDIDGAVGEHVQVVPTHGHVTHGTIRADFDERVVAVLNEGGAARIPDIDVLAFLQLRDAHVAAGVEVVCIGPTTTFHVDFAVTAIPDEPVSIGPTIHVGKARAAGNEHVVAGIAVELGVSRSPVAQVVVTIAAEKLVVAGAIAAAVVIAAEKLDGDAAFGVGRKTVIVIGELDGLRRRRRGVGRDRQIVGDHGRAAGVDQIQRDARMAVEVEGIDQLGVRKRIAGHAGFGDRIHVVTLERRHSHPRSGAVVPKC